MEQCHIRGDKISTAYMLFVKRNHLLMSIKLRIIDVSYSFQHYILTNASAGNSRCLISPAQRPNEHTTCLVTWYWTNSFCWRGWELLAGQNVLQSSGNRRKISFFAKALAWFHINVSLAHMVEIVCRNSRKLSRSMEDFGLHDKIAPSDSVPRFIVVS